jgi:hypothetical protein
MDPGLWFVTLTYALVVPEPVLGELGKRVAGVSVDPAAGRTTVQVQVAAWTAEAAMGEAQDRIGTVFRFTGMAEPGQELVVHARAETLNEAELARRTRAEREPVLMDEETVTVHMLAPHFTAYRAWLAGHGLRVFPIPDTEPPEYAVTPTDATVSRQARPLGPTLHAPHTARAGD